MQIVNP